MTEYDPTATDPEPELPVDPGQSVADDDLEGDEATIDEPEDPADQPHEGDIPDDVGDSGTDREPSHEGEDDR